MGARHRHVVTASGCGAHSLYPTWLEMSRGGQHDGATAVAETPRGARCRRRRSSGWSLAALVPIAPARHAGVGPPRPRPRRPCQTRSTLRPSPVGADVCNKSFGYRTPHCSAGSLVNLSAIRQPGPRLATRPCAPARTGCPARDRRRRARPPFPSPGPPEPPRIPPESAPSRTPGRASGPTSQPRLGQTVRVARVGVGGTAGSFKPGADELRSLTPLRRIWPIVVPPKTHDSDHPVRDRVQTASDHGPERNPRRAGCKRSPSLDPNRTPPPIHRFGGQPRLQEVLDRGDRI
jgi:hypothetical protein